MFWVLCVSVWVSVVYCSIHWLLFFEMHLMTLESVTCKLGSFSAGVVASSSRHLSQNNRLKHCTCAWRLPILFLLREMRRCTVATDGSWRREHIQDINSKYVIHAYKKFDAQFACYLLQYAIIYTMYNIYIIYLLYFHIIYFYDMMYWLWLLCCQSTGSMKSCFTTISGSWSDVGFAFGT